jgi:hypothetical protein
MWAADVSPRTAVPTQVTVGTSEPAALPDMTDFTPAGHFHLPAREVAAARRSPSFQLGSERKQHRTDGRQFYFMKGSFSRYLNRTYQLIQG